jgi:hydrogenase-4 component F
MIVQFLITSVVFALLALVIKKPALSHFITFLYSLYLCFFAYFQYSHIGVTDATYFRADHIAVIFLALQAIIDLYSTLHYYNYTKSRGDLPNSISQQNMGRIIFNMSVAGALLANHFGILWAFMEATTLAASLLIYHDRTVHALEGTWKYVFICSIGIAIAFAGILFLSIGATGAGVNDLSYDMIRNNITKINPFWLKACFIFILTGFSVKMGLVPLYNVDIDAKDVSPSPVGAKLSSILMNAGFVAIYRFYNAISPSVNLQWMNNVLLIVGIISLVFAVAYIIKVNNFKRLLAYSSMEHAALVIIAFSCGGIGYFAAILHLIVHSLVKSTLFLQFSQMHRIFKEKEYQKMGAYLKINPLGALVLFLAYLAIIGMPPSAMFISEIYIFESIYNSKLWYLSIPVCLLLLFIVYAISIRVFHILMGKSETKEVNVNISGKNNFESILQLVVLTVVFYLGVVKPDAVVHYISLAISTLPH